MFETKLLTNAISIFGIFIVCLIILYYLIDSNNKNKTS